MRPAFFRGLDDLDALGRTVGERLFAIHVLTRGDGVEHHAVMPVVGRSDHHGVNRLVRQDRLVVRIGAGLSARALDGALDPAFVGVRDPHYLGATLGVEQVTDQLMGTRSAPHKAYLDALIG
jgi:hypothetical protein